MKNLILVFSFIVLGSHLSAQGLFNNMSYDEVLKTAKAEKKPYYVDITATWCLPCKMMDETVFQDKLVQQILML
jgi:thiol:disulfide interchange protein